MTDLSVFDSIFQPLQFAEGHEDVHMKAVLRRVDEGKLNLDPPYQRDHVWTGEQQSRFMGHMLEGGATPPIIVRRYSAFDPNRKMDEVVDGKQRITAAVAWLRGDIAAELTDGRRLRITELPESDRRMFTSISGARFSVYYGRWTDAEVLRLYVRLNRGGTVHTDEEINRVRAMLAELESNEGGA